MKNEERRCFRKKGNYVLVIENEAREETRKREKL